MGQRVVSPILRCTTITATTSCRTVFFDMGGGNMLAFFDFPEHHAEPTHLGVGSMHHVAIRTPRQHYQAILNHIRQQDVPHTHHGSDTEGSLYLPDPDGIVIEITTAGIAD